MQHFGRCGWAGPVALLVTWLSERDAVNGRRESCGEKSLVKGLFLANVSKWQSLTSCRREGCGRRRHPSLRLPCCGPSRFVVFGKNCLVASLHRLPQILRCPAGTKAQAGCCLPPLPTGSETVTHTPRLFSLWSCRDSHTLRAVLGTFN